MANLAVLLLVAGLLFGSSASANEPSIAPPSHEPEINAVNVTTGKRRFEVPSLSVPAAPRLKFDTVQDSLPSLTITISGEADTFTSSISVQAGGAISESFSCVGAGPCYNHATGSRFDTVNFTGAFMLMNQGVTGARYHFNHIMSDNYTWNAPTAVRQVILHPWKIEYPDGETITFTYETGPYIEWTLHRIAKMTSNIGYSINISYQSNTLSPNLNANRGWLMPAQATLVKDDNPSTPLAQLTYQPRGLDGLTITDLAGRTFECDNCEVRQGAPIETGSGASILPTEMTPAISVTGIPVPGSAGSGDIVSSVQKDGVSWSYSYENLQAIPWYESAPVRYSYSALNVAGPNGYSSRYNLIYSLEKGNQIISRVDAIGRVTSFDYDIYGRLYRVTSQEGNAVEVTYGPSFITSRKSIPKPGSGLATITETATVNTAQCGPGGNFVLCQRPLAHIDGLGRQTDFEYNSMGQMTQQTGPADASGVRPRTITAYATSASGISRPTVVRLCGWHPTNSALTTCGTSAEEQRTEYEYWGNTNLPSLVRQVDPATSQVRVTSFTYDTAGRQLSADGPLPGSADTTYARYDARGRKTWEIGALAPNGLHLAKRFTYRSSDDKVILAETGTIPNASSTSLTIINATAMTYDSRRNPIRERTYLGSTDFSVTDRSFLDRGLADCVAVRMNLAALPLATATGACSAGTPGSQGPDRIAKTLYDAAGQRVQVRKAVGTTIEIADATYIYTNNGQLKNVIDAVGNKAELRYDGHDRQVRWVFPSPTKPASFNPATPATAVSTAGSLNEADYELYAYDAAGNRTSFRKRDGSTLTYLYDNLNRMTRKTVPARAGLAATHTRDVDYGYNLRGLQLHARFDSGSGEGLTTAFDGFGQVTSASVNLDGQSRQLSYLYDAAGNRTRITHPDAAWFGYAHDALGRLGALSNSANHALVTPAYNNQGLLSSAARYGTAHNQSFTYDTMGRLATLGIAGGGNVAPAVSWTFTRNAASQILTDTRDNDAYAWTGAVNVNRNYTTNGLSQYTAAGGANFCHDANGNLTADGSSVYLYDIENRLVEKRAQTNSNCASLSYTGTLQASLRYDPLGRLHETIGGGTTTRFLYDGDALVGEYNSVGALQRRYVHGSNIKADDPLVWFEGTGTAATNARHLYADPRGSIVLVGDSVGAAIAINAYDEYGIPKAGTIPEAGNIGRFQYTGQAWVPELGMYYYKARIYSPTLGRFLQTDPIGYEDQINLYAYVGNDPVNGTDPSGMQTYFWGGAGNDDQAEYKEDFVAAFREAGISDPKAVSEAATSNGIAADLIILPHINNVTAASISTPGVGPDSDPNTQYNLVGYSYGSALAAQQALTDAGNGNVVSNLVLIGAPLNQDLMNAVNSNTNIRNVITINIPGDPIRAGMSDGAIAMASPQLIIQMARGTGHFTYAGSSATAAERRRSLARDLYGRGVR